MPCPTAHAPRPGARLMGPESRDPDCGLAIPAGFRIPDGLVSSLTYDIRHNGQSKLETTQKALPGRCCAMTCPAVALGACPICAVLPPPLLHRYTGHYSPAHEAENGRKVSGRPHHPPLPPVTLWLP
eukprot:CAMPEP_0181210560 /NCGR_PEP_ID=MMETSP1096-20121128/23299_1 /TAXON_ID=156174 ORGANISM="Chrysochromulina ericina, Strain CCMP281" /NCGR_SAMPLE_ID=MMETSP1096 /ASSEMBLY_ACC=CAM_ASM_000453 /LENGTH=126 /DNA_ID=CAMNT_0023301865 /DNA_START=197 /DNA_END=578 /DNA_ORIENTATION=+